MLKIIFSIVVLVLFSGCGLYTKITSVVECIDNKVNITIYEKDVMSEKENIKVPTNIIILHKTSIKCIEEK